jgi:hypothetical protein
MILKIRSHWHRGHFSPESSSIALGGLIGCTVDHESLEDVDITRQVVSDHQEPGDGGLGAEESGGLTGRESKIVNHVVPFLADGSEMTQENSFVDDVFGMFHFVPP